MIVLFLLLNEWSLINRREAGRQADLGLGLSRQAPMDLIFSANTMDHAETLEMSRTRAGSLA